MISTAEQLANLSGKTIGSSEEESETSEEFSSEEELEDDSDNCYQLIADIDLGAHLWVPITYFNGFFDGGGYTISNMTINGDYEYAGFIGEGWGTCYNIIFRNANVSSSYEGSQGIGVFIGRLFGLAISCWVYDSNVSISNSTAYDNHIGGVVGYAMVLPVIAGCFVYNTNISVRNVTDLTYVGGIVGGVTATEVILFGQLWFYNSNISIENSTNIRAGGIVGGILSVFTASSITIEQLRLCKVYNSTISNNGGSSVLIGGIVGRTIYAIIGQCAIYNSKFLNNGGSSILIGGLVGETDYSSQISNSYVLNTEISKQDTSASGGLIGNSVYRLLFKSTISNCYISNITSSGSSDISFVGSGSPITSQLYNDSNLNTLISTIGSLAEGEVKSGWDESIWGWKSYINGGKPYLKWMFWEG